MALEAARWYETIIEIAQLYEHEIFSYMVRRIFSLKSHWQA